jgi:hypothetical protein
MSARVLPWLRSHWSSLRSALSRSFCGAFLSMNTAKMRAKRCADVSFFLGGTGDMAEPPMQCGPGTPPRETGAATHA